MFNVAKESNIQFRGSFQKSECPFCKTNNSQFALFHIAPTFWNKAPEALNHTNNLNTFKHNLKNIS